jgi:hypothetical protein
MSWGGPNPRNMPKAPPSTMIPNRSFHLCFFRALIVQTSSGSLDAKGHREMPSEQVEK